MLPLRILLRFLPALLAMLLCAAPPAAAELWTHVDAATAAHDGAAPSAAHPPNAADHASKRAHHSASLQEFVGIDDDAEQYLLSLPVLLSPIGDPPFAAAPATSSYRAALPNHPACAAPPTGPPHA
jgi:hypothetical protein